MSSRKNISRRQFLKRTSVAAAGAIGFPYVVSSSVLGAGSIAPSNRITLGFIGTGKQGYGTLLRSFLNIPDFQVIAVCDVDALKCKRAKDRTERKYARQKAKGAFKGCADYNDFRDLLARDDIDAIVTAPPDHWHSVIVIQAAQAGKDIYCEKPLSLTLAEARVMVNEVRRYERVFQLGSMQRSWQQFRLACELVRSGYIGELKKVRVSVGGPPIECDLPAEPTPDYLDWNMWLGQAPWRPYNSILSPHISWNGYPKWRRYREFSGGDMIDTGAHHFDIAQWGIGADETGPVEIIPPDGKDYRVLTYKYANGITMTRDRGRGILFTGTEGKVEVSRKHLRTWPDNLAKQQIGPDDTHLYKSNNHYIDWLRCIRNRRKPVCDVEVGCRSVAVCLLGNIAYELKRPLKWDPQKEVFVNDSEANRLMSRPMRSPWHL